MASKLGEAYVDVTARKDKLDSALNKAERQSKTVAGRMQAAFNKISLKHVTIGVAAVSAVLTKVVYDAAKTGDEFHKMSLRTGETAETLSKLQFAAERSGSSIVTIERALRNVSQRLDRASRGSGEAKEWLDRLGISATDASGSLRQSSDVMLEFADKLQTLTSESEKAAAAAALFGMRAGPELLPLLKEGKVGIEALGDKLEGLGGVVTTFQAEAGAEFIDAMTNMATATGGLARELGTTLLPVLTDIVGALSSAVSYFGKLKSEGRIRYGGGVAGRMGMPTPEMKQKATEYMLGRKEKEIADLEKQVQFWEEKRTAAISEPPTVREQIETQAARNIAIYKKDLEQLRLEYEKLQRSLGMAEVYGPPAPSAPSAPAAPEPAATPAKPLSAAELFERRQAGLRPIDTDYSQYAAQRAFEGEGTAERMRRTLAVRPTAEITMPELGPQQQDVGMIWTDEMLAEQNQKLQEATSEWTNIMDSFAHRSADTIGNVLFDAIDGRIKNTKQLLLSLAQSLQRSILQTGVNMGFDALRQRFGGGSSLKSDVNAAIHNDEAGKLAG